MAYNSPPKHASSSSYLYPSSSNRSIERPTSYFSLTSPNRRYFADQALRSDYRAAVDSSLSRESEFLGFPDLRDPVQRQMEKNRIREEMMAEQMERRRILEEEVRMELRLEREMNSKRLESLHSGTPPKFREFVQKPSGSSYDAREIANNFLHQSSRPRLDTGASEITQITQALHEPPIRPFDASIESLQRVPEPTRIPQPQSYLQGRRYSLLPIVPSHPVAGHPVAGVGILGPGKSHLMLPATSSLSLRETKLSSAPSVPAFSGIKPRQGLVKKRSLMGNHEKGLSNPDRKRKASVFGAGHPRPSGFDKKPKKQWNCRLCDISTNSEQALKDHLNGKKHKSKEEESALAPSNPAPSHPIVKNTAKPNSSETSRPGFTLMDAKQKGKLIKSPRTEVAIAGTKQKAPINGTRKLNYSSDPVKVNKLKFWCELCQVGVTSETVLASHYRGRKHAENLELRK